MIVKRPFLVWYKNVGFVTALAATIIAAIASFLNGGGFVLAAAYIGYFLVGVLLLYSAASIVLFILGLCKVNINLEVIRKHGLQQHRSLMRRRFTIAQVVEQDTELQGKWFI